MHSKSRRLSSHGHFKIVSNKTRPEAAKTQYTKDVESATVILNLRLV